MMSGKFISAMVMFVMAHTLIWYCHNSQLVWEWWKDKWLVSSLVLGTPATILFWFGTKLMMEEIDTLWTVRFTAFALSYLAFPFLTWLHLGENPFTVKTIICTLLALVILLVQVGLK
jgi:hypothetical protein